METFASALDDAYGHLPAQTRRGPYRLDAGYRTMAMRDVFIQLNWADVDLAVVLSWALGHPGRVRT
jgi:hypothetical protein